MKYIITENQFQLVNENKISERIISIIKKIYYEKGKNIHEIQKITGLPMETVLGSMKDFVMDIDCGMSYDLIRLLLDKTWLLSTGIKEDGVETLVKYSRFDGTVQYTYENDKYILYGFATPYWGGDCTLPIENQTVFDKLEREDEYNESMITIDLPNSFRSISELIDWYNSSYLQILLRQIKKFL